MAWMLPLHLKTQSANDILRQKRMGYPVHGRVWGLCFATHPMAERSENGFKRHILNMSVGV